ncbi:MAG: OmpA family protein [Prosthecobacter sp.]|jgi:outer membrane protein OmpA-like peptidoglycan-associated protein|uniref:OmpA family protein n=1 Tax=Prosthecobacter sp. TaxID=1965333 RepID=UPI001A0C601E|nr:OmpA family protein [Prosthecobacter sp.]MBE2283997.1 OmpA family protein [Prosthecobacter sp.]
MKTFFLSMAFLSIAISASRAQQTVVVPAVPPPPVSPPPVVVVPQAAALDPVVIQRQLSTAPVLRTTRTTTVVETPGRPTRVYESERNVVVVEDQGQFREMPYVTLPVLFVKETAELLDAASRAALEQTAGVIRNVVATDPKARFDIEGHTSTDGTTEFNASLSAARAQRVYEELTRRYAVPATVLSAHGYGESFPAYPNGTEAQMQLDRRVLVVRTR